MIAEFKIVDGYEQDLPGAASADELGRQLHLKELDSRESNVMAISAYDGYVTLLFVLLHDGQKSAKFEADSNGRPAVRREISILC